MPVAETEILPDDHGLGVQALDEDLGNKFLRSKESQMLVERKHENVFCARFTQKPHAIFQATNQFGHPVRCDKNGRMRMKSKNRRM